MTQNPSETLFSCLELKKIDEMSFEASRGPLLNPMTIYGGERMAQGLKAAILKTSTDRKPITFHCYFHAQSSPTEKNTYQVENMREGNTFSHKLVRSYHPQAGITFQLDCSFKAAEIQPDTFTPKMPECKKPDELPDLKEYISSLTAEEKAKIGERRIFFHMHVNQFCPFEFKAVNPAHLSGLETDETGEELVWMRVLKPPSKTLEETNKIYNDSRECFLAYMSDLFMLDTANVSKKVYSMLFSLNHTMWLYNPWIELSIEQWILMAVKAQHMDSGIAVVSATMWLEDGTVLATMTQQGLMRDKKTSPK